MLRGYSTVRKALVGARRYLKRYTRNVGISEGPWDVRVYTEPSRMSDWKNLQPEFQVRWSNLVEAVSTGPRTLERLE